jgi:hypothetical protein
VPNQPSKGGAPVGNSNRRTHGLRTPESRLRAANRLRAKFKRELLLDRPRLSPTELGFGVDIKVHAQHMRTWIAGMANPASPKGQTAAFALDRLLGRWEHWCERNEGAKRSGSGDPLADLLASLAEAPR